MHYIPQYVKRKNQAKKEENEMVNHIMVGSRLGDLPDPITGFELS